MRRQLAAVVMLAALPYTAQGAWVMVSSEAGRRVELDPATIKKEEGNKQVVTGRALFEKDLSDPRSSSTYRSIETVARYDCGNRTITTLKRSLRKADGELLREEELKSAVEVPVRAGSIDEKLMREVCRGSGGDGQAGAAKAVDKANEAAADLRKANDAMIQKELQKGAQKAAPKEPPKESTKDRDARKDAAKAEKNEKAATETAEPAKVEKAVAATKPVEALAHARAAKAPVVRREAAHHDIHWSYDGEGGPDNWGKLKRDYATCANGQRQSPIDIRDGIRVDLPPLEFSYRPSLFRIIDNGHTVQVSVSGSAITLLGKVYELVQLHFHRPAEERVNGRGFEMVAHLVHKSEDGRLAVIAVLMERGAEHPFIQTLWNYMPLEKNEGVTPPGLPIDPLALLPADKSYYTYMGSLTTPPCTENVLWLVLKQPIQVSAEQIAIFSRLYRNNARPIQPGFGRLIKESR